MAIDRSFTVPGHGTVVTGTVASGSVAVGDELELQPLGQTVRVRGLHRHDRPVQHITRGSRAAINLVGVHHAEITRGHELASPGYLEATRVLTVDLIASDDDAGRPLKHRDRYKLHIGTTEVSAVLSLLERSEPPRRDPPRSAIAGRARRGGAWSTIRVAHREPARYDWRRPRDRSVVAKAQAHRSASDRRAGAPPLARPNRSPPRRPGITRHTSMDRAANVRGRGLERRLSGIIPRLAGGLGLAYRASRRSAAHDPRTRRVGPSPGRSDSACLGQASRGAPATINHLRARLEAALPDLDNKTLVAALIDRLKTLGKLIGDARTVALPGYEPKLSQGERKLKLELAQAISAGRFSPPEVADLTATAGTRASVVPELLTLLREEQRAVLISPTLYLDADVERDLRRRVAERLEASGTLTMSELRELLGTTRKYAVPIGEYLDRIGLTLRDRDLRRLNPAGSQTAPADESSGPV